jgi:hypothetical protein
VLFSTPTRDHSQGKEESGEAMEPHCQQIMLRGGKYEEEASIQEAKEPHCHTHTQSLCATRQSVQQLYERNPDRDREKERQRGDIARHEHSPTFSGGGGVGGGGGGREFASEDAQNGKRERKRETECLLGTVLLNEKFNLLGRQSLRSGAEQDVSDGGGGGGGGRGGSTKRAGLNEASVSQSEPYTLTQKEGGLGGRGGAESPLVSWDRNMGEEGIWCEVSLVSLSLSLSLYTHTHTNTHISFAVKAGGRDACVRVYVFGRGCVFACVLECAMPSYFPPNFDVILLTFFEFRRVHGILFVRKQKYVRG